MHLCRHRGHHLSQAPSNTRTGHAESLQFLSAFVVSSLHLHPSAFSKHLFVSNYLQGLAYLHALLMGFPEERGGADPWQIPARLWNIVRSCHCNSVSSRVCPLRSELSCPLARWYRDLTRIVGDIDSRPMGSGMATQDVSPSDSGETIGLSRSEATPRDLIGVTPCHREILGLSGPPIRVTSVTREPKLSIQDGSISQA